MRISRRASRTTAAGVVLAVATLTATACSSSSSSGGSASQSQSQSPGDANANENDIQILNSLQLTGSELDASFATDNKWQAWIDPDLSKLLIKQARACTKGVIDTTQQSLQPVTTAFKADQLPGDVTASATSTPGSSTSSSSSSSNKSPSNKKGSSATSSASSSAPVPAPGAGDGNPTHWVVSTAIAYKTAAAAKSAVGGMGQLDATASNCGGPGEGNQQATVGGGIGEVGPTWNNSQGVFVYVDTKTNTSVSIVGQRRGRYVVLTYTRGSAAKLSTGYYDLEAGPDTSKAAAAATAALAQLTDAVVNS